MTNNPKKSRFLSCGNCEQTGIGECLLSFTAESFLFQFAGQKHEDWGIKNYNFASSFVLTWNLISHTEGGTQIGFFENKVLRKIFWPKRDEVTREWRRLHNKELYDPYSSPNIIWVMKSRRMRWVEHIAHMGVAEVQTVFGGKPWGIETTWKT